MNVPIASSDPVEPPFRVWRSLKLGTFHIGSSLTDLLTSAVWNRILIADLGIAAWPVALLTSVRYLLSPLTLWAGYQSDTRPLFGSRRLAYIWLGRLLMLLSLPLLPLSLAALGHDGRSPSGWTLAVLSFLLYGIGTLISGAPFLALVHDSAPYARRGQAISIVQTFLVASFAFGGFLYGRLLPDWDYARFWRLVLFAMIGAFFFWVFSVWGEEKRPSEATMPASAPVERPPLRRVLAEILGDHRTRRYALFLSASAFFAFMQDAMLEPFGGDVFGLSVGETTRFNAYWGMGVLLAMVLTAGLTRRRRPDQQVGTTAWGLALLATSLVLLSLASALMLPAWIRPVLFLFGVGFGIFTVGGVSLLMAMSKPAQAGSYLALWSMLQLVTRGFGISMGGVIRDVALQLTGAFPSAYAALFAIEALGLYLCIYLLVRVNVPGFVRQQGPLSATTLLAAADGP
jgi:BCD family chlorophyll transporter-like MFS transporter